MNLLRLSLAGLVLASVLSPPATAQILDPGFASPTSLFGPGQVYAVGPQQADGKRVVAGNFLRVNGTPLATLVRLDANGALDVPFSQNVGAANNIYRVRALPSGQYLLGANGGVARAGGLSRVELLRLNANGTADASFDAGAGPASNGFGYSQDYAAQPDGKIVVVGYFDTFNNVPASGIVRLNANGSVDTGFNTGTGVNIAMSQANTVAVQPDGKILVGGRFTTFNGQPANGVVRLNANGSTDATFTSVLQNASVGLVLQPDGKVLVYGFFTLSGGAPAIMARLNANGTVDPTFSPVSSSSGFISPNGFDRAVVLQPDGRLLVGGTFPAAPVPIGLLRLNADGTPDPSFQTGNGPSSAPSTIGLQANGSVVIGGSFSTFNGSEAPLGRLTSTGAPDPAFSPNIQGGAAVTAMVRQADGKLVIGGSFTEVNGVAVHRVARLSDTGVVDAAYAAATTVLPGPVQFLALQPDGKVLAGTTAGLVRLATTGNTDGSFTPAFRSFTNALAVQPDGRILWSTGVTSNTFRFLVRLTPSGANDPTFARPLTATGPGIPGIVDAIVVQPDGRIVVGGAFQPAANQQAVARVVRYDASGALDAAFTAPTLTPPGMANFLSRIYSLALQPDGRILAGGTFQNVNGTLRYGVARLAATGGLDASFAPSNPLTGTVFAVTLQPNGRVLLGGAFTNATATGNLNNLTRLLADGQTDTSFGYSTVPNNIVRNVVVQPDGTLLLAGNFATVGGQPALGVARLIAADVLAVAAPAAVAARTAAWPVPAHGQLHIAPDAAARPQSVELLDALGRPVRAQPLAGAAEVVINVENLPTGMYLLRVRYAVGTVTRRIAVQ